MREPGHTEHTGIRDRGFGTRSPGFGIRIPNRDSRVPGKQGGLTGHHVGVEVRRTTDRLSGVVDDEVQSVARGEQLLAEGLDAWRVAQVEAEDLETILPFVEIGLPRLTRHP